MNYELRPVMDIDHLEEAIHVQYGVNWDLRTLLFDNDFVNDCFKSIYFREDVDELTWGNNYQEVNTVFGFLRDILPGYDSIVLDVSW